MITTMKSRISRIHPIYDFHYFPENGHSGNGYFREKFQISYLERIRKNPKIHPSYNFSNFLSKMTILV